MFYRFFDSIKCDICVVECVYCCGVSIYKMDVIDVLDIIGGIYYYGGFYDVIFVSCNIN